MNVINLLESGPARLPQELVEDLYRSPHVRIERIVSRQHATPSEQWYDQEMDEYVVLLAGGASLSIEGMNESIILKPGDAILLPAHVRHRVEWTAPECDTIWLAIHIRSK